MSTLYTPEFYDRWAKISQKSAEVVVPLVLDLVPARSVLDVGCGTGIWLAEFRRNGVDDVIGLDGDYVERDRLEIPDYRFTPHDLARRFDLGLKFDLAVSLEVAEHLPFERAESFVEDLTRRAPVVLFSAAVPGQDGRGHVNCQWPSWWAGHFARRGFVAYDPIRPLIWNHKKVAWWYRQNILLFAQPYYFACLNRDDPVVAGPDIDRVHPQHWKEKVRP